MATIETTIHALVPAAFSIGGGNPPVINAETFGGSIPGTFDTIPAGTPLTLNVGDTLIVRLINDLPYPTGIHWHGIELENCADGTEVTQSEVPGAPLQVLGNGVPAGGTFLYKFKVPRPGIFWFHPHHHHSTNRVFRGQYGMILVKDAAEDTLVTTGVLPSAANTRQLVLSDITVCKAPGTNDAATYVDPTTLPVADRAEWLSGVTSQTGPTPLQLCETAPLDDMGMPVMPPVPLNAGEIPNTFSMAAGISVEGQTVLTNGINVGGRLGTPAAPTALSPGFTSIPVAPGQGIRLQIANTATTRYFRLVLTTSTGAQIDLIRVGGEGGILNDAIREGGITPGGFNTQYSPGEILIPPACRADVVAVIPLGATGVCTMWTRDFPRLGGGGGSNWPELPTVPVLHLNVTLPAVPLFPMVNGTPLKSSIGASTPALGPPTTAIPFLDTTTFVPTKPGIPNLTVTTQDIQLNAGGGSKVNNVVGSFDLMPYTTNPHIDSTRYAKNGDLLQFRVINLTPAHHPFHLHGFSFQPISLGPNGGAVTYNWPFVEFRDTLNIPAGHTLTLKAHISDRELADGATPGGAFGRWLFHCHIFFHAHHGMISELVITDPDGTGSEKPNVNVNGSWAYANTGGIAIRKGTYFHPDGDAVILTATLADGTPIGAFTSIGTSTWEWQVSGLPDQITYVYITATDSSGRKDQAVFRLKIGIPDDGSDNGDPHIHTVDGKYYDFQAAGEFTLLKDREGLEVQSRQTPVLTANPITDSITGLKSCVSLNTAVAARVGTHRIAYQPGREHGQFLFFIDGKPSQLSTQGINLDDSHVSSFDVNGASALRVDYSHGPVLMVTPLLWTPHNMWYLNISISRTQADEGIMGVIPRTTWLPLLPSGASVGPMPTSLNERYTTLYKTFADAWRLTDRTSLFVYEKGTSTDTFTDKDWPAGNPPCNLKPEFEIPGWVIPEGMDIDKAKQVCEIITDEGLNRDCVFDVATTGDEDFAQAYRITQELRQRSTGVQIVSTKRGEITVIVSALVNSKSPAPKGKIRFYVDNVETGQPMALDSSGHVKWKINGLDKGTYSIRAVYTPADASNYSSSSPNLKVTLAESTKGPDGGANKGCLAQPWYVWIILFIILILFLIWVIN